MEDQKRTRLIMLSVAGLLLLTGLGSWLYFQTSKTASEPDYEAMATHRPTSQKPAGAAAPAAGAPGAVAPGTAVSPSTPNVAAAPGGQQTTAPAGAAPATGAKPGTAPGAPGTVAATPAQPGTGTAPNPMSAVRPTPGQPAQPATQPAQPNIAAKPNGAPLPANLSKPPASRTSPNAPDDNNSKAADAAKQTNAKGADAAKTANAKPADAGKPANAKNAEANKTANAKGADAAKPAAAKGDDAAKAATGATDDKNKTADSSVPKDPTQKAGPKGVAPTSLASATNAAASEVGRPNPTQPLTAFLPFPRNKLAPLPKKDAEAGANGGDLVPPPPPDAAEADPDKAPGVGVTKTIRKNVAKQDNTTKSRVPEKLVPPPPPTADSTALGVPIEQLPVPPSKPTIGDKMKVLAVMDDKVIIAFPSSMRVKNKWPKSLTLATGQEFESIKVVGVSKDGVTIEEDGERTLKPVPSVK